MDARKGRLNTGKVRSTKGCKVKKGPFLHIMLHQIIIYMDMRMHICMHCYALVANISMIRRIIKYIYIYIYIYPENISPFINIFKILHSLLYKRSLYLYMYFYIYL